MIAVRAGCSCRRTLLSGYLVAVALTPTAAEAAIAASEVAVAPSAPALLEVVVSARRREENLQEAPLSVSVFSSQDLEDQSIVRLQDVAEHTPNLRSSSGPQGGSSGHYFIRGIGQLDFIASTDPGVGTYVDGVYLGRTTGAAFDLLNVERVEVLRGPQGTLFGRNTIGGAINVISAEPPAESERSVELTAGSRDRQEGRLRIAGPLVDERLFADVAMLGKSQEGWQRRLVDGMRFGDEETYAARAALKWQATERLMVLATADATRSRGTADPHFMAAADSAEGGRPEFVVSDPSVTWSGQLGRDDLDVHGMALTINYDFGGMTLKSISAWRSLDSSTGIDFDGSPYADLDQLVFTQQHQFSQELQLGGIAFADSLTWLVGLYYFGETVDQAIPLEFYGTLIAQNNDLRNDSYAVFAHGSYALTERWSISAGARLTYETKEHAFDHYVDQGAVQTPLFPPTTLSDDWRSVTPKLGIEYQANDGVLLYASLSQGFRSGGFNGRPLGSDEFLAYRPETLTTYEIGLKSEWLARRLRLNAAGFYSTYDDIQLTLALASAEGVPIVVTGNAGQAEIYGLEAGLTASLAETLLLEFDLGTLHNAYTELAAGASVQSTAQLPVSPGLTVNAAIEYAPSLGSIGRLRGRVDYAYTSRYNFLFDNPELSWQSAYSLWNVRLTYEPANAPWKVAAFVVNAADQEHSAFREDILSSAGTAIVWPARPREWGLEFEFRF